MLTFGAISRFTGRRPRLLPKREPLFSSDYHPKFFPHLYMGALDLPKWGRPEPLQTTRDYFYS